LPTVIPSPSDKPALRSALLAARRGLTDAARDTADRALVERAVALAEGRRVAAYLPLAREPGGAGLIPALVGAARQVIVPVLLPDRDLDWSAPGEPDERLGPAAIGSVDLVLVPALAVDRLGVRLGRGGGSYDRALARVSIETPVVALLYDGELREHLPAEPHDRRVTGVLLPSGATWITIE
jgi:5-formyltetrahydrofolate cyclo-ligase